MLKAIHHNIVILIPSLEPSNALITYVEKLINQHFFHIVVVDDGSGQAYEPVFNQVKQMKRCTVLRHGKNQGKGQALKTGYAYIGQHFSGCKGVITVDSDGQHAVEDVCKVAKELQSENVGLLLGSRNFALPTVPMKSKVGNRASSALFFCLYGKWIKDTQTGLRGFGISFLEEMTKIKGKRFEYEMQVIISCILKKIPMKQIEIQTIYNDNNESTHFQACKDSIRIMKVIFQNFIKFIAVSGISAMVDLVIAWYLLDALGEYFPEQPLLRIGLATGIARTISMIVNYFMNKIIVFEDKKRSAQTFMKYTVLCMVIMVLSALFVYSTYEIFGWDEKVAKVFGDSLLFFVSYKMQQHWVFHKK